MGLSVIVLTGRVNPALPPSFMAKLRSNLYIYECPQVSDITSAQQVDQHSDRSILGIQQVSRQQVPIGCVHSVFAQVLSCAEAAALCGEERRARAGQSGFSSWLHTSQPVTLGRDLPFLSPPRWVCED